jgi:hypothetical protein
MVVHLSRSFKELSSRSSRTRRASFRASARMMGRANSSSCSKNGGTFPGSSVVLSEDGMGLLPFSSPLTRPLIGGGSFLQIFGVFLGPFLSAFIMTGAPEGKAGIRRFLRRFVLWRVGIRWHLFVLIAPPVVAVLVTTVLPGALASLNTRSSVRAGLSGPFGTCRCT